MEGLGVTFFVCRGVHAGRSMVLPLAEDLGQERQHVLRPDTASPPNSAEAVSLQILLDVLRVDLSGVRFSEPLELAAKNATRLQARILRWLNQKHGNLGFSRGYDEPALKQWIAIPAQRCRRDCHRCLIACATLSRKKGLDSAVRAAGDRETTLIDVRQALQIREPGELVVELLALQQLYLKLVSPSPALRLQLVLYVGSLRVTVPASHRREDHVAGGHEDCGDRVELRCRAGVLLAAVIPDKPGKWPRLVGPEKETHEREVAALECHAFLRVGCRRRVLGARRHC